MRGLKIELKRDVASLVRDNHEYLRKATGSDGLSEKFEEKTINRIEKKAKKYTGNFLVIGERFFPFFNLPFVNYEEATFDVGEHIRGVMHDVFDNYSQMSIHYKKDQRVANVFRPGLIGYIFENYAHCLKFINKQN
jgi:hypothetical protein